MRRAACVVLVLVTVTFASASLAVACDCGDFLVEDASKASASIFIGEVVRVSDRHEMLIESKTEEVYLTKFLVWERWKGQNQLRQRF
jgi:hypothetical protein